MKMSLKNKKILAIIPARGGSKRLPNKNILPLHQKPLISWTIEEAKKSKYISKIIISTDDERVKQIAEDYSIEYISRSKILSSDEATTVDVVVDVINKQVETYDYILLLQPTSPLRNVQDINNACELLNIKNASSIISMCEVDHPVQWNTTINEKQCIDNFIININTKRSQELETHYRLNGAIYLIKTDEFLSQKSFFSNEKNYAYIMTKENSIDIDDKFDFQLANNIKKEQIKDAL